MKLRQSLLTVVTAAALLLVGIPTAGAIPVDNSIGPVPAFCSGACGVGSAIGLNRTVEQVNMTDNMGTSFSDLWTFSLSESGKITGFLFANNTLNNFRLEGLKIILQNSDGTVTFDPIAGYTVPNPPPVNSILSTALTFANLGPGDYQFRISGLVPDTHEFGQYQLQASVSEIPLPAAFWLLLTALAGLVTTAKIRRKQAQTT